MLFNGLSLELGDGDRKAISERIKSLPEVKAVYQNRAYHPTLYASRELIDAQALWNHPAMVSSANAGRGIKIAIMDGGIHHLAPMFSGAGFQYPADIPAPGLGDTTNNNGKVIVSRAYFRLDDPPTAGDENVWPGENGISHGVHVAGIAAGNPVSADYLGLNFDISGVAPAAWLMSYRVFYPSQSGDDSFYTTEGLAALEDIVADGADVLNNSWGSGPTSAGGYYVPLDRALINAAEAGIFVVMSVGNSGPGLGTGDHPSADYISVASSTTTSALASGRLNVTAPLPVDQKLIGLSMMEADFGPSLPAIATYDLLTAAGEDVGNQSGCSSWTGTPFTGKAVLIERGGCYFSDKVFLAQEAGASLVIIYNHEESGNNLVSMTTSSHEEEINIPAIFIKHSDGLALLDWCNTYGAAARIEIDNSAYQITIEPDRLSDFSSKGPGVGEVLKPDITAPGDNILSQGYTPHAAGEERHFGYGQSSGTSMAAPHVAGAAALIRRQAHPDWPNSYIKSALMTTSVFQNVWTHDNLPGQPLEIGAGRLNLSRVTDPGIICQPPAISFGRLTHGRQRSLTTTITNISPDAETYTVTSFNPRPDDGFGNPGLNGVTLSPANLTLAPGASAQLTITIDSAASGKTSGDLQGYILLSGTTHDAHLPLWARIIEKPNKEILLLDNDGSSGGENRDYRRYYTSALDSLGKSYTVWDVDAQTPENAIPAASVLSRYPNLIYFSGDNWAALSDQQGNRLTEYANGGGRMLAMGQDISNIFNNDEIFYSYVLGGRSWWDNLTDDRLPDRNLIAHADAPPAFSRVALDLTASGDGAGNQHYMDELQSYPWQDIDDEPLRLTYQPLLRYPGALNQEDGTVALAHRTQPSLEFLSQPYAGRSIFTSFGLEGVNNLQGRTSRSALLDLLLAWLADEPTATISEQSGSTSTFKNFRVILSSPVSGTLLTRCRWDFGDSSPYQGPIASGSRSHSYARPGNYLVRAEATDNWENQAIGQYLVTTNNCLYYPHVATSGDWETEICIINTGTSATITGAFKAYADNGTLVSTLENITLPPRPGMKSSSRETSPARTGSAILFSRRTAPSPTALSAT